MAELICIVCPKGCRIEADSGLNITGYSCERGEAYARGELQNPVRTLTSTVCVSGAALRRCPVKTRYPIPKRLMFEAMRLLDAVELSAPVEEGQVVIEDICGTGIPFVTTRNIKQGR
jgi:CxxC motif-containing protein